jgi:hypothetical protein
VEKLNTVLDDVCLSGKMEFNCTPKDGSWLNMAEIEINMRDRKCLARRIGEASVLGSEINHCTQWTKEPIEKD